MAQVEQKVREHYHLQADSIGNVVTTVPVAEEIGSAIPEKQLQENIFTEV